jgi:hypothetical protein
VANQALLTFAIQVPALVPTGWAAFGDRRVNSPMAKHHKSPPDSFPGKF